MSQSPAVLRQSQVIMANNCGDAHEWFRTVVDRFEGPLVRYAKLITGDTERVRDVVQEAFLWVHREFTLSAGSNGQAMNGLRSTLTSALSRRGRGEISCAGRTMCKRGYTPSAAVRRWTFCERKHG